VGDTRGEVVMESKCIVSVLCGRKKGEKCLYQEKNRGKKDNNDCGEGWYDRFGTCNSDEASVAALRAALEELGGGWQPIETAPKDGTEIIVWWPEIGHPYITKWTRFINGNLYRDGWHCGIWEVERPTHWMPLPKPPKE